MVIAARPTSNHGARPPVSSTTNALTGTPLAGLRLRQKWLDYARALVDGVSLRKAAALSAEVIKLVRAGSGTAAEAKQTVGEFLQGYKPWIGASRIVLEGLIIMVARTSSSRTRY